MTHYDGVMYIIKMYSSDHIMTFDELDKLNALRKKLKNGQLQFIVLLL